MVIRGKKQSRHLALAESPCTGLNFVSLTLITRVRRNIFLKSVVQLRLASSSLVAARGEPGEILVRSSNQMVGYINQPKVTAETIDSDRFVHTGDVGIIDDSGNLFIVDRLKSVCSLFLSVKFKTVCK